MLGQVIVPFFGPLPCWLQFTNVGSAELDLLVTQNIRIESASGTFLDDRGINILELQDCPIQVGILPHTLTYCFRISRIVCADRIGQRR